MNQFDDIVKAHAHIDATLASQVNWASHADERNRLQDIRKINDESFFVLLFAQFEAEVNDRARRFIQRDDAASHWANAQQWDSYRGDAVRRIPFLIRCGFLTDPNGQDYQVVRRLYEVRNQLAHRGVAETSMLIQQVAADLKAIAQRLH